MQTFLPYSDFKKSAKVLDDKRLGKQRVEAYQILQCLLDMGCLRWKGHPAVRMWDGFELHLYFYTLAICKEWTRRGHKDTVAGKVEELLYYILKPFQTYEYPWWLGFQKLHKSHQSNLVRKDPQHYRQYFPTIKDDLPYWWPCIKE